MKLKIRTAIGIVLFLQLLSTQLIAQEKVFSVKKKNWASPFKAQSNNGCCIFSMVSLFESEIYRITGQKMELSQMYLFYHVFIEKTERYLRLRSLNTYSTGGLFDDALYLMDKYGVVPLDSYPGLRDKDGFYQHGSLYGEFEYGFLPNLFEKAKNHELHVVWKDGIPERPWVKDLTGMLDRYIGKLPTEVNYRGKSYTPVEFAKNVVNLPVKDYVKLTSYSNMSFYRPEALTLKDNWLCKSDFYSLPIDRFIETIDYAINHNFTLAIDMDITVDQLKDAVNYCDFNETEAVNQDVRDTLLDNWNTTDVHLVHLIGIAYDEDGKKYYMIKDSVGPHLGVFEKKYLSENYVRGKVLAVILHKDGIPSHIKREMSIE